MVLCVVAIIFDHARGQALLRVEVIQAADRLQAFFQVVAEVASPGLRPWDGVPAGETGLALDNGALVVFTRANVVVVVRGAGAEPIDVRSSAARIDAWLIGAGTEREAKPGPLTSLASAGTGWLRCTSHRAMDSGSRSARAAPDGQRW